MQNVECSRQSILPVYILHSPFYIPLCGLRAQAADVFADGDRRAEDRLDWNHSEEPVPPDRREAGRSETPAVAAIGRAPELARRDLGLEIRRDRRRRAREEAVVG